MCVCVCDSHTHTQQLQPALTAVSAIWFHYSHYLVDTTNTCMHKNMHARMHALYIWNSTHTPINNVRHAVALRHLFTYWPLRNSYLLTVRLLISILWSLKWATIDMSADWQQTACWALICPVHDVFSSELSMHTEHSHSPVRTCNWHFTVTLSCFFVYI